MGLVPHGRLCLTSNCRSFSDTALETAGSRQHRGGKMALGRSPPWRTNSFGNRTNREDDPDGDIVVRSPEKLHALVD